ncbi:MAG TPA: 4'-phosphopantetheinyl transferase superfamily protein [Rhabdaerophilum sp.]|nr:4'-phosphopantetheinyl transferase superfamily protein [Rhabdaerophilum sp.]
MKEVLERHRFCASLASEVADGPSFAHKRYKHVRNRDSMQKSGIPHWLAEVDDLSEAARRFGEVGCVVVLVCEENPPAGLPPSLPSEMTGTPRLGRRGFLLRRQVARQLASAITGFGADRFVINASAGGAPAMSGPGEPLWLSLSCRGGTSLVALARMPIGVDIEMEVATDDIPVNVLRDDERKALNACSPGQRGVHFSKLWARKEALAKALHLGFVLAPEAIRISEEAPPSVRLDGQWRTLRARLDVARIEIRSGTCATFALALLSSPDASAMTDADLPRREPL